MTTHSAEGIDAFLPMSGTPHRHFLDVRLPLSRAVTDMAPDKYSDQGWDSMAYCATVDFQICMKMQAFHRCGQTCDSCCRIGKSADSATVNFHICTMQNIILGKRLRKSSPAGGRKLRRAIGLPISNNCALHSIKMQACHRCGPVSAVLDVDRSVPLNPAPEVHKLTLLNTLVRRVVTVPS